MNNFVVNEFPEVPGTVYVDIPEGVVIAQIPTTKVTTFGSLEKLSVLGRLDVVERAVERELGSVLSTLNVWVLTPNNNQI